MRLQMWISWKYFRRLDWLS